MTESTFTDSTLVRSGILLKDDPPVAYVETEYGCVHINAAGTIRSDDRCFDDRLQQCSVDGNCRFEQLDPKEVRTLGEVRTRMLENVRTV